MPKRISARQRLARKSRATAMHHRIGAVLIDEPQQLRGLGSIAVIDAHSGITLSVEILLGPPNAKQSAKVLTAAVAAAIAGAHKPRNL